MKIFRKVKDVKMTNISFNGKLPESSRVKEKGSVRAAAISQVIPLLSTPLSLISLKGMKASCTKLTQDQMKLICNTADDILVNTGLADKGVKIINHNCPGFNFTCVPDKIFELINPLYAIARGNNACFTDKPIKNIMGNIIYDKNVILINKGKLPTAIFHEMGHAFNNNKSSFWKIMQKMRVPGMIAASALALYCAFTKEAKPEDAKELTKAQKVKNTVRNNSGKIAFAAMLPMLLEEGMASIRGCKWANANLTKDLARKVLKTNIAGYTTYLFSAIALGLSAFAATKVKDSIMNKQAEQQKVKEA